MLLVWLKFPPAGSGLLSQGGNFLTFFIFASGSIRKEAAVSLVPVAESKNR